MTAEGQRVQMDGVTTYKVRKPGFVIDYVSDLKSRRFIYDGKNFTVVSPKLGYYATVPAPATNREVLELAYTNYGIKLPLEDLFRWNDPNNVRAEDLKSGYKLGTATLGGVQTDHYVFREDADRLGNLDPAGQPAASAKGGDRRSHRSGAADVHRPPHWKVNPPLTDADFAFTPSKDDEADRAGDLSK